MRSLGLALRLARRELRGGLRGFRIFIACLALGVAAIATVQSVADGIVHSLRADGRAILGGDAAVRLLYRTATPEQLAYLNDAGRVSTVAEMRAMASVPSDDRSTLIELKAVDGAYPLYGALTLDGGGDPEAAFAPRDGVPGALAEAATVQRLGIGVGDRLRIGGTEFELRGLIGVEPDRAGSGGFTLGPRVMIRLDDLPGTGLIQPGSLIEWNYRLALPPGTDVAAWQEGLAQAFPEAGWRVRDFTNAAPGLQRFVERLALFLTLVGLTSLLVGGVGVGNAVRSFLDGKAATIATLKCIGAPGQLVFATYLIQILALAGLGILIGLCVGALAPPLISSALAGVLPVTSSFGVYPPALLIAAAFGLLTALTFSLWPLGRSRDVPAAALFRGTIVPIRTYPRASYLLAAGASALALAGLAVATAENRPFAAFFVLGAFATLLAFRGAAAVVTLGAARMGRPRRPGLRLALANLHRPGNPTGSVVLSLGLGLTVLVAIMLIEGNFSRRIQDELPDSAPAFFFIDVQPGQYEAFRDAVMATPGADDLRSVPMLRGRIATVNGIAAEEALVDADHAWVLRGDRGITYSAEPPVDARIVSGNWWPADYRGAQLVSISTDVADAFGIAPGARVGVNILGRVVEAEVASVRDVDFTTLNINFTLVFSPGILEGAPQTFLATVQAPPEAEPAIQRAIAGGFPNVTAVRVRDALDTVNDVLGKIGTAVRLTAGVTLAAGTLVLAGAVAAGHRRRVYDAVVLKVLGATRADVLRAFLVEYGLLGLVTAAISGAIGTLTAWAVLTWVMGWPWTFIPWAVVSTLLLCTGITLLFGFLGTWRALGQPAAPLLRND
jgi:putative ABC transport system permease protein